MGSFPAPIHSQGSVVDTEERRTVVRKLTDALYDYLTLDVTEMERAVKMREESMPKQVMAHGPTPEMLVEISDEIDGLRSRIEFSRAQLSSLPSEMRGLMEAGIIGPMEDQLHQREKYLSAMQKAMEQQDVPR